MRRSWFLIDSSARLRPSCKRGTVPLEPVEGGRSFDGDEEEEEDDDENRDDDEKEEKESGGDGEEGE